MPTLKDLRDHIYDYVGAYPHNYVCKSLIGTLYSVVGFTEDGNHAIIQFLDAIGGMKTVHHPITARYMEPTPAEFTEFNKIMYLQKPKVKRNIRYLNEHISNSR